MRSSAWIQATQLQVINVIEMKCVYTLAHFPDISCLELALLITNKFTENEKIENKTRKTNFLFSFTCVQLIITPTTSESRDFQSQWFLYPYSLKHVLLPPQNSFSSPPNGLHSQPVSSLRTCCYYEMFLRTQKKPTNYSKSIPLWKPTTKPLQTSRNLNCYHWSKGQALRFVFSAGLQ